MARKLKAFCYDVPNFDVPEGPVMRDFVHLSIIIPAYREETRLIPTLTAIEAFRARQPWSSEVLIVDDGSPDGTARVADGFAQAHAGYRVLRQPKNMGKGSAVQRGMREATGRFRLFTDADLSTPIEDVEKLLSYLDERAASPRFDVAIGSRRVRGAVLPQRQPLYREASGRIFSLLVRAMVMPGFLDTQCGFKLYTADAANQIFPRQTIPGFGFDVETLFIASHILRLKIKEAPVQWTDSPSTTVRLFRDSLRMFKDLLVIRRNNARGIYAAPASAR